MDAMQTKQAAEEAQKKWMRRMGMITGPSANFLARGFGSLAAKIEKETTFLVTHTISTRRNSLTYSTSMTPDSERAQDASWSSS